MVCACAAQSGFLALEAKQGSISAVQACCNISPRETLSRGETLACRMQSTLETALGPKCASRCANVPRSNFWEHQRLSSPAGRSSSTPSPGPSTTAKHSSSLQDGICAPVRETADTSGQTPLSCTVLLHHTPVAALSTKLERSCSTSSPAGETSWTSSSSFSSILKKWSSVPTLRQGSGGGSVHRRGGEDSTWK